MKHTLDATPTRLIKAATKLFQSQGYFATSVADILLEANAPKGSLYHHFPEGKSRLAVAAVEAISADVLALTARAAAKGQSPADQVRAIAAGMGAWLRSVHGQQGSLLSVLAMECAHREPVVHAAVKRAYDAWRSALARQIGGARARAHANVVIAALEGGLILARLEGRSTPLLHAGEGAARLLERKES